MTSKPAAPPGIGVRGRRFWSAVMAKYAPTIAETEILREAARTLDELDALEAAVRKDGAAVSGSKGQRRSHPGLAELRALRAQLVDLLGSLSFEVELEVPPWRRCAPGRRRRADGRIRREEDVGMRLRKDEPAAPEPEVVALCRKAWKLRLTAGVLEDEGHLLGAAEARAELAGVMAEIEALPDPVPASLRYRYLGGPAT